MKDKRKRLNLALDADFYQLLEEQANQEYLLVSTYVKRLLQKSLSTNNNFDSKCTTQNEADM